MVTKRPFGQLSETISSGLEGSSYRPSPARAVIRDTGEEMFGAASGPARGRTGFGGNVIADKHVTSGVNGAVNAAIAAVRGATRGIDGAGRGNQPSRPAQNTCTPAAGSSTSS